MPKNSTNTFPRIFGLAGSFASGKDSLATFLEQKYKIKHLSTSDIVREEAMKKYGSIERPILYQTANEYREEKGAGIFSKLALERYRQLYKTDFPGGVCVSGFRAIGEAEVVRQAGGVIIFVDASPEVRYRRTIARARDNEVQNSFQEFLQREAKENGGVNPEFNIAAIKKVADVVVDNSVDLESFLSEAKAKLKL